MAQTGFCSDDNNNNIITDCWQLWHFIQLCRTFLINCQYFSCKNVYVATNFTHEKKKHAHDVRIIVFIVLSSQYTMDLSKWIDLTDIHNVSLRTFFGTQHVYRFSMNIKHITEHIVYSFKVILCLLKKLFIAVICCTLALDLESCDNIRVNEGGHRRRVFYVFYQTFHKTLNLVFLHSNFREK